MTRRRPHQPPGEDALADLLADERRKVTGWRSLAEDAGVTFRLAAAGYLHRFEHLKGREGATPSDYQGCLDRDLQPRLRGLVAAIIEELRTSSCRPASRPGPSRATSPWPMASSGTPSAARH